jgi:hypothetical protein
MYFILRELLPSLFLITLISLVLCLVGLSMSVAWHAVTRVGVKNGALRRGRLSFFGRQVSRLGAVSEFGGKFFPSHVSTGGHK